MTLKRVVDFVKDKGDEGMNEKYRKCQRMLEETLTKNMALQNVSFCDRGPVISSKVQQLSLPLSQSLTAIDCDKKSTKGSVSGSICGIFERVGESAFTYYYGSIRVRVSSPLFISINTNM